MSTNSNWKNLPTRQFFQAILKQIKDRFCLPFIVKIYKSCSIPPNSTLEVKMPKYHVIAWRAPGEAACFFRGDNRYAIYLPFISSTGITKGWVSDISEARVFEGYPCLDRRSASKRLDLSRIRVFPYDGPILSSQIFRPIVRPRSRF